MAKTIDAELPADIKHAMRVAPLSLETLWDERTQFYYSRDSISGRLIKMPDIATFLPLYALKLPPERVKSLLTHLHDPKKFGTKYPIPSAPLDSKYFKPHRYWQGPTWINVNWLIIKGLQQQNELKEAALLRKKTIELVKMNVPENGFHEYYSPLDGTVAGAPDFSWTAALIIYLLK
jgi:glycogen debranching enzyme